jgi:hypothetical protein
MASGNMFSAGSVIPCFLRVFYKKIEKHLGGGGLAPPRTTQIELRVVVAAVLAVATDAVLVAHYLPIRGGHLATALAHLNVKDLA